MKFKNDKQRRATFARLKDGGPRQGLSVKQLQRINAARRPAALLLDLLQRHKDVVGPDDPAVHRWVRDKGSMDIMGIDTPGSTLPFAEGGTQNIDPLEGDWVVLRVKGRGSVKMDPQVRRKREANIKALEAAKARLEAEVRQAGKAQRAGSKGAAKQVEVLQKRRDNAAAQLAAYRSGHYLVLARKEDEKILRDHAKVLREFFDVHPRQMETNVVVLGRTDKAGMAGYTHEIRNRDYRADFIAMQERAFFKDEPIGSLKARPRRLTHVHEQVHVMRNRESGRKEPEVNRPANAFGGDRDTEEKFTVLETNVRAAPTGNLGRESYYAAIPGAPAKAGDVDNAITQGTTRPKRSKDLGVIGKHIHARGKRTHIARLKQHRSGVWGAVPPSVEKQDQVVHTGKVAVHASAKSAKEAPTAQDIADAADGRRGGRYWEYWDGRKIQRGGRK
jgi:hypothetical protein